MNMTTYNLSKDNEWGQTVWVLWAPNCSPFGRYTTKAAALADARLYGLRIRMADDVPRRAMAV
jgi:hypothetical protein